MRLLKNMILILGMVFSGCGHELVTQAGDLSISDIERVIAIEMHTYHGIDESWFDSERGEYGFTRDGEWCPLFRSVKKWKKSYEYRG